MEIKYTLEILTKDIQDIEKLVGNLQNSPEGSSIELDLALSKLRNVYEILTMIKADRLHDFLQPLATPASAPKPVAEAIPDPEPAVEPNPEPDPEPAVEPKPDPDPEPVAVTEPASAPKPEPETKKEAEIIAEKFSAESSINENLAGQRGKDLDTQILRQPIDNIKRNIGINDRFLIIRELFDGDADKFNSLIINLEGAGTFKDAITVLEEQFSTSMEHEGVEILSGLVKRMYTNQ